MALFQKKPQVGSTMPLYTLGLQKTVLIVGLGNIGKQYEQTRHNIGFKAIDNVAEKLDFPAWAEKKDMKCQLNMQTINESRVILIKPTTLMNLSGEAVQAVQKFYNIPLGHVVVVHDELDIPFGQIRVRVGGSDAGNNGVKSVIQHAGEGFGRVRVGIKNEISEQAENSDFVLGKFTPEEKKQLPALLRETSSILSEFLYGQPLSHETRSFLI